MATDREVPYVLYVRKINEGLEPEYHKTKVDKDGKPVLLRQGETEEEFKDILVNRAGHLNTWAKPQRIMKMMSKGYQLKAVSDIPSYCNRFEPNENIQNALLLYNQAKIILGQTNKGLEEIEAKLENKDEQIALLKQKLKEQAAPKGKAAPKPKLEKPNVPHEEEKKAEDKKAA